MGEGDSEGTKGQRMRRHERTNIALEIRTRGRLIVLIAAGQGSISEGRIGPCSCQVFCKI